MNKTILIIILILLIYIYYNKESFKQELSAVPDNINIREYPKPSFIQDNHPESGINNLKRAKVRFNQSI